MELSHWLSLFSICLLGAMSPGPSLAVVMNNTLRGGHNAGYASALAVVLFLVTLTLTVIQWSLRRRFVYNEQ